MSDPYAAPRQPRPPYPLAPPPAGPPLRQGRRALRLVLVGAVLTVTPLLPVAVLLTVSGVVLGVRALVLASRRDAAAPGAVAAVAVGLPVALFGLAMLAIAVYLSGELADFGECLQGANTGAAREACTAEFTDAYRARLGRG